MSKSSRGESEVERVGIRVQGDLKNSFIDACDANDQAMSEVLREFMQNFVGTQVSEEKERLEEQIDSVEHDLQDVEEELSSLESRRSSLQSKLAMLRDELESIEEKEQEYESLVQECADLVNPPATVDDIDWSRNMDFKQAVEVAPYDGDVAEVRQEVLSDVRSRVESSQDSSMTGDLYA